MHPMLAMLLALVMWGLITTGISILPIRKNIKHLFWSIPLGLVFGLFFSLLFMGSIVHLEDSTSPPEAYSPAFGWTLFGLSIGLFVFSVLNYYQYRKANPQLIEKSKASSINFADLKSKKMAKQEQAAKLKAEKQAKRDNKLVLAKELAMQRQLKKEQAKKVEEERFKLAKIQQANIQQSKPTLTNIKNASYPSSLKNIDLDDFESDADIDVFKIIQFDYVNAKGENKSRRVKVIQAGDFYFDAIDLDIHQSRTFRYDRIDGDVIIEDTGEVIRPSRLHNYFQANAD